MLVAEVEPFIRRCCLIALKFGSRGAMCWRKVIRSSKRRKSGSDFACWHFLDVWNPCTCFSFVFVQVFLILWGMHWVRRRRDLNSWPRLWVSDMQALWDLLVFARTRGFLEQRTFYDARVCSCLLVFVLPFMLLHHYLFVNVGEDGQDEGGVTQDWSNMFNLKVFTLHQGNWRPGMLLEWPLSRTGSRLLGMPWLMVQAGTSTFGRRHRKKWTQMKQTKAS